ncbi:RasGEF domain protein, partial [Cooperia oncophora]
PSYAWLRALSVRQPVARQVSLSFEQWSPEDISTSLSHIDYKVLSRISIAELKRYVKDGSPANTPMLERSISIFNNLSNWVQIMVLSKTTPKERAAIVTKFVNVGKHLRKLCNFNTLMAVIGGITHSNISRLSKRNSQLAPETRKVSVSPKFIHYYWLSI